MWVLELITKIAMIQWEQHHALITETSEFENLLLTSESKRRSLLQSIVSRLAEKENLKPYDFSYLINPVAGINLLTEDFIWLVEKAKAENCGKRKTIWIHLVNWSFNRLNLIQIDALLLATREDLMFQNRFGGWFAAIDLDSAEAKIERERYQEMQKSVREQNKKEGFSDQEIKERISYYLNEFSSGNIDAWWRLNQEMTLRPYIPYYENEWMIDLTDSYGWQSADLITKNQIINAARGYITKKNNYSNGWIDKNTYDLPSFAGCRALFLLLKEDLTFLNQITPKIWSKWTPVIVAFPSQNGEALDIYLDLLKLAYSHAPQEFIDTLVKLIDSEGKDSEYISSVDKLEKCWDDTIKSVLLNKIQALDLQPKCITQLLKELLKQDHEQSRDFAKLLLAWSNDDERKIAISAAEALLNYTQQSDWDNIWQAISKDLDFAKESLEITSCGLRHVNLNLDEKQL